ncbi:preprotein translocase subunit SecA [Dolichospermum sp. LEGE 00240]|jgi:preprotein translocase subunit SecA|uniref:preprotein translocase subunit SecA n=1 Tax=Dolichospermum sp. LEGE 00240 TaxID=1828603 RepID=UPI00187E4A4D|nr:preprotein translocase subunit SecA [Dolichospermum sp. LEGE 00240]MDM3848059.1 preprotein translocase subunit SecA [Aphanizomenon gracile PMC638.10]MDM3849502.1 preprotein translocase subunit SecA [Aphanizomenon gracile PMC627.10]MDM3857798.1 preprotein translocase subunit SecA [Aphanizomenon gracile PMC649.10]MDM3860689.1 preprotein translocase subunit SecA [Aphanizomenon gracile PMC644.10]MBE9248735.1 preprotein translocase subunit SecA [Dolichospermum sp. LEGE 00240]
MLKLLLGDPNARKLKKYQPYITEINLLEEDIKPLSDEQLKAKTVEFKQRLAKGETLDDILPEAFAVVRESGRRVLGLRHFDVQLQGGIILHTGQIAEMKTGEGKTLVATLPSYLNALTGKGVHVITVNDYLARRDAEWMGQVHRFLGLSVGLIQSTMTPSERQKNYACDITYVTNSEIGFDYLRDNMATSMAEVVQRPFNFCVIDEVDSILVDEARTPLIISGQVERPTEKYLQAAEIAFSLKKDEHYEVNEKDRNVLLTDEGFAESENQLGVTDLFDPEDPWAHFMFNAIKAKELFLKDVNYIVRNDEVVIVDEFTGRVLPGRRWSDGLHQAIEAKEHVEIQPETQTLATITYQNLFLLYPKLGGMTGTAKTEEVEFEKIYKREVTIIPTNRIRRREDLSDMVFKTEPGKWRAIAKECAEMHENGRPVLVGTTSVEKSELLSRLLKEMDIPHELLNARPENVEREAEIIAQAGRSGAVTIATNMAGRGTDIILGGNSEYMARLKLREYFMPRIVSPEDDEFGVQRASGLPMGGSGGGQGFVPGKKVKTWRASPEIFPTPLTKETEQLLKAAVEVAVKAYGERSLPELEAEDKVAVAAEKAPTDDVVIQKLREAYQQVKHEYEEFTSREHDQVVERGGLHVIGTERHESRRIDNQLRGRAGRQGDPGTTRFFLSLEDNLLRIFGGDRVAGLMNAFQVEEDMPIESGMLTRSLEGAQKKVETYYYDIRKQVFEYDEVMNNQRRAIYAERRRVLEGQDLKEQVIKYAEKTMDDIVDYYINPDLPSEEWELDKLVDKVKEFVYLLADMQSVQLEDMGVVEIKAFLHEQARIAYDMKESQIDQIQPGLMRQAERFFILQRIDTLWREHLQQMDALRESVGLRGYGQKDPLIEYKSEGYELFLDMMVNIRRDVVYSLFMFQPQAQQTAEMV